MKARIIILILLVVPIIGNSQNDTINQRDESNLKQGHWIYYGKDRPRSGYPDDGKMEEGSYLNDRKEGLWVRYHTDGVTPKFKVGYHNNRPIGKYWKGNLDGTVIDSGTINRNHHTDMLIRGRGRFLQDEYSDTSIEVSSTNYKIRGCVTGSGFQENGYNKVCNVNDEIWQDGEFRNGRLWNGKVYLYDSDGILISVKIFKNGVYCSDGQL